MWNRHFKKRPSIRLIGGKEKKITLKRGVSLIKEKKISQKRSSIGKREKRSIWLLLIKRGVKGTFKLNRGRKSYLTPLKEGTLIY